MMVAEVSIKTPCGKTITPDGTLKDSLRQDWGYWESKDEADDLNEEIRKKFEKGYPKDNILFEDSRVAVLIQKGEEVVRCYMRDENALHLLLTDFFSFERPEVQNFRKAIELFKQDIPKVTDTLRNIIMDAEISNIAFIKKSLDFLTLCRESINPCITREDVREMIIQHILTEDIFNTIFDETQFHRENNIARELEAVIATFFTGNLRRETLHGIKHYYDTINAAAAGIADHHEKQKFLKVVYETFYKSYNPKAADRLGVVYTPNEIVRFMIESADYLLHKHFDKYLEDHNVEILDPATGTGTFVCDLIDYLRKEKLEYKYRNEIHANEVAILPYYISNLNIEFTYAQKMGCYAEFENLCFVDTLDNMGFGYKGKQEKIDFFSEENSKRIQKQNKKKIAVIIGNPPYNANQANENDNNKNREYPLIDKRIKDTFIKYSTAQKTKVYDMYARFYRWAFDRLEDNGIVAFITNRSFIDSRTFDGFRKTIQQEFEAAYIIDTLSDVRANPKIAGTTHNVFGIQTGVAVMFLVKKKNRENETCKIHYVCMDDFWRKEQKLQWLAQNPLRNIPFEIIRPDKNNNWINLADNDFESLLPLCSKNVKTGKSKEALFELYSTGIVTARDEWVYSLNKVDLDEKVRFFIENYNAILENSTEKKFMFPNTIKWSRNLKNHFKRKTKIEFNENNLIKSLKRPFYKPYFYFEKGINDEVGYFKSIISEKNCIIGINNNSPIFNSLASDTVFDFASLIVSSGQTQCLPLYRYDKNGNRIDNITDWGYEQFKNHYTKKMRASNRFTEEELNAMSDDELAEVGLDEGEFYLSKEYIFYYIYAVLHNPKKKKKYELNLKRDFPRIPFYDNFHRWVEWGEELMNLHVNYETAKPYSLQIKNHELRNGVVPKPKLKADKEAGVIILDEQTELYGIPAEAWNYKLGNRSALEWILDQYQEKKPKDPTIAEKFNTYHFADYKEQVIDLLKRVCTVSVETMKIVEKMGKTN
jgi:predicted helicase